MALIKLGVIGLGRMGLIFCKHLLRQAEGACLAAVSSRRPEALSEMAGWGPDIKTYRAYQDLLVDPSLDGVIIATHTHTHHDIVTAAAQAGKAIFCEKPIALTLAEAVAMVAAVEKASLFFQIGFMRRFDKGYAAAKKQIEAGAIGTPVVANAISRDPGCPDADWAAPANSGGLIVDLAIHDIDILRWLMADEVVHVYVEGSVLTCPDLAEVNDIDSALVTLRFAQGGLGSIDACRNARYGYDIRCEIRGTEGTLQVGYLRDTPMLTLTEQGVSHDVVPWFEERFTPAYGAQIDHFIESLQQDRPPSVGLEDALRSLQICLAATQSQREGRPIVVSY